MPRKRIEVKYTEGEADLIKKTAEYLQWKKSEVLRRSLRFGLNALLKFETNRKMDLRKLSSGPVDQDEDIIPREKDPELEKQIEIANVKWLDD